MTEDVPDDDDAYPDELPEQPSEWRQLANRLTVISIAVAVIAAVPGFLGLWGGHHGPPSESAPTFPPSASVPPTSPTPPPSCTTVASAPSPANGEALRRPVDRGVDLPATYSADLDTLCVDWRIDIRQSGGRDITSDGTALYPTYTAKLATLPAGSAATYDTCNKLTAYVGSVTYRDLKHMGRYCVVTNEGRLALLEFISIGRADEYSQRQVRLKLTVWDRPGREPAIGTPTWVIIAVVAIGLAILSRSRPRRSYEEDWEDTE